MIRFAAAGWLASFVLLITGPASADAVDDYVQATMKAGKIPGVSIVVRRDGQVIKSRGYGFANLEHQVPATEDTIYQSGSMGKQFTAAGILLLVEDGKLSLDDRLAKFYPDGPPSWHRITIRQLLAHTSGIKDYSDEYDMHKAYTEAEQVAIAKTIPLDFEPGTQWSYSNTGYLMLGALTSKLAGKHWSEFQSERIFKPLGMTTARMISEADIIPHRAAGYEADDKGEPKNQAWVAPEVNTTGDGALYFSAKDLAAWDAALDAQNFMSPEHFKAWWTPVTLANGTTYPYGFGWAVQEQRGHALIEHGGAWQGFRTGIVRYPEQRVSVSVLANSNEADSSLMARTIAGLVEPSLALPDPEAKVADPDPARTKRLHDVLQAYADYRTVPAMGKALAETAAGSAREGYGRAQLGETLAKAESFRYIGEDDLTQRPVDMYGDRQTRSVYYRLKTKDERSVFKFRLNEAGQALDFEQDER